MSLPIETAALPNWTGNPDLVEIVWKLRDQIVERQRAGYIAYKLGPDYDRFWTDETQTRLELLDSCEFAGIKFFVTERRATDHRRDGWPVVFYSYEIAPFHAGKGAI